MPGRSIDSSPSSRDSGTRASVRKIASATSGTFDHHTHCQPSDSVSAPPMSGPIAKPSPTTAAQTPIAAVRRSGGKATPTRDSEPGTIIAEPRPGARAPG